MNTDWEGKHGSSACRLVRIFYLLPILQTEDGQNGWYVSDEKFLVVWYCVIANHDSVLHIFLSKIQYHYTVEPTGRQNLWLFSPFKTSVQEIKEKPTQRALHVYHGSVLWSNRVPSSPFLAAVHVWFFRSAQCQLRSHLERRLVQYYQIPRDTWNERDASREILIWGNLIDHEIINFSGGQCWFRGGYNICAWSFILVSMFN